MKKITLITGIADHDVAHLSEFSFKKVSQVSSIKRRLYNFSTQRVEFEEEVQRFYKWYINNSGN